MKLLLEPQKRVGLIALFIVVTYIVKYVMLLISLPSDVELNFISPVPVLFQMTFIFVAVQAVRFFTKGKGLKTLAFFSSLQLLAYVLALISFRYYSSGESEGSMPWFDYLFAILTFAGACYILVFYRRAGYPGIPEMQKEEVSPGRRFVAVAIDSLIVVVISGVWAEGISGSTPSPWVKFFCLLAVHFLYFFVFEGLFRFTPGKIALGLRVVSEEGDQADIRQIFVRNMARLIPLEALTFITGQAGLHDRMSYTQVLRYKRIEESEERKVQE